MRAGRLAGRLIDAVAGLVAAQSGYLLLLSVLALPRRRSVGTRTSPRLAVLVPAHDEELSIASAVRSLRDCDYPEESRSIVVIADNCTDDTARLARDAGAQVHERADVDAVGKGAAVAWALGTVAELRDADVVVMMDADCVAEPGLLRALADAVAAGAGAAQGAFLGSNPDASRSAALRWAGYALMNLVRPTGRDALGLSCGLTGSGMAFAASTLRRVPWEAFSVTEDKEQHLRLVQAGIRVRFAPGAIVRSPMVTDQHTASTQQMRWETGNVQLARRWVPTLIADGARHRDVARLQAAWDLLIAPLSVLVSVQLGIGALGLVARHRRRRRRAALGLAGIGGHVGLGLAAARAPTPVVRALAGAPSLALARLGQYTALARGRGHRDWRRTPRSAG